MPIQERVPYDRNMKHFWEREAEWKAQASEDEKQAKEYRALKAYMSYRADRSKCSNMAEMVKRLQDNPPALVKALLREIIKRVDPIADQEEFIATVVVNLRREPFRSALLGAMEEKEADS